MQKASAPFSKGMRLSDLRNGAVLPIRVFLLCLLMLLGTVTVANHVHESALIEISDSIDGASGGNAQDSNLENLVAGDCDQFHINSLAVVDSSPASHYIFSGREKGLVACFSADSLSPELFPPARAPPSGISLT
jgi:hypothetical protein